MKRKPYFLLLAGLAFSVFSGLIFIDNISVVIRWHRAFAAANSNASQMPAVISGIMPAFDWAAVDFSCVTTFIPFFGFINFFLAMARIVAGKKLFTLNFPFFRSYDQLNIALGLIGTLWGIIMIGYYDMESVTMADLINCLHTALFSTLAAVVWVYIIVHPILIPLACRALDRSGLAMEDENEKSLDEALSDLRAAAAAVGSILDDQRPKATALSEALQRAGVGIDAFSCRLETLASHLEDREKSLDCAVKAAFAAIESERKAASDSLRADIKEHLDAMDAADAIRRSKFADDIEARLDIFEKALAAREKRFDDTLNHRIARLSQENRDNQERADKAETALKCIRDALDAQLKS